MITPNENRARWKPTNREAPSWILIGRCVCRLLNAATDTVDDLPDVKILGRTLSVTDYRRSSVKKDKNKQNQVVAVRVCGRGPGVGFGMCWRETGWC